MPELPEVETTKRGIAAYIEQQIIKKVIIRNCRLRWDVPINLHKVLRSQKVLAVERRAKYILIKIATGAILIHLGMSGYLRILTKYSVPLKHDHIDVIFNNGIILRFNDQRRFGMFLWLPGDYYTHSLLKNLGVEPLSKQFSTTYLWSHAQKSKIPIKALLMDHTIVTGIGNIYAAEALFAAGIYPLNPANKIALVHIENLVKHIKRILRNAICGGGTTFKDFKNSEGKPGYFAIKLKVYGRAGLPCVKCKTKLKMSRIRQRATVYCINCQKN